VVQEAYVHGVSTRAVDDLVKALGAGGMSKSQVSRLCAGIDKRSAREVKRRADVVGIFPNDETIIRMVGAQMLEINDEWAVARRYMSLEGLARVMHIENVRLPAVVA